MLKTWVFHFQSGAQSADAFSYIHFSLFGGTNIAKDREYFPAFTYNLKKHIDNQMIILITLDLEHYSDFTIRLKVK